MIKELKSAQSRNVIYQTTSFFPAHAYAEMVDGLCWLFYYCLYLPTLARNGYKLGGLSPGKLKAMTDGLLIPTRIFDLLAATLAPTLIHENVFIPSPSDVLCVNRKLDDTHTAFGVMVGSLNELYLRYCVTMRSGYIAYLNSQSGESILLKPFEEKDIQPSMRMIAFLPLPTVTRQVTSVTPDKLEIKVQSPEIDVIFDDLALPKVPLHKDVVHEFLDPLVAAEAPKGPQPIETHVESFDCVLKDYEPKSDLSSIDSGDFFVPFPFSHLDESELSYQAAAHLALTMYTNYNMRYGDPSILSPASDITDYDGYVEPCCFGMATRTYNSYVSMYSLRTLKSRELWQVPRVYDFLNLENNIVLLLMQAWDDYQFPSLCITEQVPIPSLGVKLDSPFFPPFIRWNRKLRSVIKPALSTTVTKNEREEVYRKKSDTRKTKDIKAVPPDVTDAKVT